MFTIRRPAGRQNSASELLAVAMRLLVVLAIAALAVFIARLTMGR